MEEGSDTDLEESGWPSKKPDQANVAMVAMVTRMIWYCCMFPLNADLVLYCPDNIMSEKSKRHSGVVVRGSVGMGMGGMWEVMVLILYLETL